MMTCDVLALRADWVMAQPLTAEILAYRAVLEAESLIRPNPQYAHIAIRLGSSLAAQYDVVEERWNGCNEIGEVIDDRWDMFTRDWRSPEDADRVAADCCKHLHDAYGFSVLWRIGESRILHLPIDRREAHRVCSTLLARAERDHGYNSWPFLDPDEVMPSDYPGLGWHQSIKAGQPVGRQT